MEALRGSLTAYAYNICGSAEEARDIVQDVFLQFMQMDTGSFSNPAAYLRRMVVNLAITRKKAMLKRLSSYRGEWLPEPVATESADSGLLASEVLSYSLMVLLEKLDAMQRAVFILKEAFNYEHSEIAGVLEITPVNSRQLLSRARKQLKETHRRETKADTELLSRYLHTIRHGDVQSLEILLSEDVKMSSDGGGKVSAALKPIYGRTDVSSFISGIYKKFYTTRHIKEGVINHQPALLYYEDNILVNCQIFSISNDLISEIYFIRNPDKLNLIP